MLTESLVELQHPNATLSLRKELLFEEEERVDDVGIDIKRSAELVLRRTLCVNSEDGSR